MGEPKKIAAIITTCYRWSHADVLLDKFLYGFPTDEGLIAPRVRLASVYMDQRHPEDRCVAWSEKFGFSMHESICSALRLGGKDLAVDGVLIIGEHGDYPWNEKDQHLYPRRHFMEQVCGVFAASRRSVPVLSDKHLSYNWPDAAWMYRRAQDLKVPLMAGSSIPYTWRSPWLEYERGVEIDEALAVGYGGLESYGFHMLEGLQCMVERRRGGETGVQSVQCLEGEAVWEAARQGLWSRELADAACAVMTKIPEGHLEQHVKNPAVFLVEYSDGLKGAGVMLNGHAQGFGYAARSRGSIHAFDYYLPYGDPWAHFSYFGLNIEEMFVTGRPPAPVERTLLTSGILDAAMTSRHEGHRRIETPHLAIRYETYDRVPIQPRKPRPEGASIGPWPPKATA
ncbi:MAG: hypothetical protein HYU36_15160 [Planctomycetes bacterium]|nr:hypothetical protein [Planctomycetota bacterium]